MDDYEKLAGCIQSLLHNARCFTVAGSDADPSLWGLVIPDDASREEIDTAKRREKLFDVFAFGIRDAAKEGQRICISLPGEQTILDAHADIVRFGDRFRRIFEFMESDDPEIRMSKADALPFIVAASRRAIDDCGDALDRLWPKLIVMGGRNAPAGGRDPAKSTSANQEMAAMVQRDPSLVSWPASRWAEKLGVSPAAVRQTHTWRVVIKGARDYSRSERASRQP